VGVSSFATTSGNQSGASQQGYQESELESPTPPVAAAAAHEEVSSQLRDRIKGM